MPTGRKNRGATGTAKRSRISPPLTELLKGPKMRTTLLISEGLDHMVEVCAAVEKRQKSDIVNEALAEYLVNKPVARSFSISRD
jgi:hypothetical protein